MSAVRSVRCEYYYCWHYSSEVWCRWPSKWRDRRTWTLIYWWPSLWLRCCCMTVVLSPVTDHCRWDWPSAQSDAATCSRTAGHHCSTGGGTESESESCESDCQPEKSLLARERRRMEMQKQATLHSPHSLQNNASGLGWPVNSGSRATPMIRVWNIGLQAVQWSSTVKKTFKSRECLFCCQENLKKEIVS